MIMTKNETLQAIIRAFPYPQHITDLRLDEEPTAVRFTWRGERFRVAECGIVETVEGACLHGSNIAILAETLIKNSFFELCIEREKHHDSR